MNPTEILLAVAVGLPLLMVLLCVSAPWRQRLPFWFPIAPLPALALAIVGDQHATLVLGSSRFAFRFALDMPGAVLLGTAAILWAGAGSYAAGWLRSGRRRDAFVVCWLMAMTGSVGVFLAADLIGFYLMLAVLSVGASGLVLQGEGGDAVHASGLYLGVALLAEAFVLAALVLMVQATPDGSLLLRDAAAALRSAPSRDTTLILLLVGLGMKAGLVPMHFWMPRAYRAAPVPAAAVMSGAVVKASVIALVRFVPFAPGDALPHLGMPMAVLGMLGAFCGVAIGVMQSHPKVILAYSSVSQMGFLMAIIGMGLAAGNPATVMATTFYAAHHLLVKGTLFLAVGVIGLTGVEASRRVVIPTAIIALGLGGLPLTGGSLAKVAAKAVMDGALANSLAVASSVATILLMLHFVRALSATTAATPAARAGAPLSWAWLGMLLVSLVGPWILFLHIPMGTLSDALAPAALWAALWPVLAGAVLAAAGYRLTMHGARTPSNSEGGFRRGLPRFVAGAGRLAQCADAVLREWSVSCLTLLLVVLLLGGAVAATA